MSEFFKAELKDKFLRYASERDDYFETQLLYDEYLRPNYSLAYVERLIREIIDHNPELLDIISGNGVQLFMLSSTALTEDFLDEGGFTHLYVKEEEKWDTFLEQLSDSKKLSREEKVNLARINKSEPKKERTLLKMLIAAVTISFLFTVFSVAKGIFFKEDYVTNDELNRALEKLRSDEVETQEDLFKNIQTVSKEDSVQESSETVNSNTGLVGQDP